MALSWEESKRRERLRFWKAYLRGWDSALIYPCGTSNPYHRNDYRRRWARGRQDCLDNKPLPKAPE